MRARFLLFVAAVLGGCSFPTDAFRLGGRDSALLDTGNAPDTAPAMDAPEDTSPPPDTNTPPDTTLPPDSAPPPDTAPPPDSASPDTAPPTDATPPDAEPDGGTAGCATARDCEDMNPCTADTCDTSRGVCVNAAMVGCCVMASDCDDGNVCTLDACVMNRCANAAIRGCCLGDAQCDDGDRCTLDACDEATQRCRNTNVPGCCTTARDCDDMNRCTVDACDNATRTCTRMPAAGCCASDADCNDGNACTRDNCNGTTRACINTALTNCCTSSAQCSDGDSCTADTCRMVTPTMGACDHVRSMPSGDRCAGVIVLPTPTTSLRTWVGSTTCAGNDFTLQPGRDVVFQVTLPTGSWVLYADAVGSAFDSHLGFYSAPGCPAATALPTSSSDNRCGTSPQLVQVLTGGTYHLVLDSPAAAAFGTYLLHYRAVPVPSGVTVNTIPVGRGALSGSTGRNFLGRCSLSAGASNSLTEACVAGSVNAPELVFAAGLCSGVTARASTCPTTSTSYDTVLALRADLGATAPLACNDNDTSCGLRSTLSVPVPLSNVYFLVADGVGSSSCGALDIALSGF
ncbi:MAG: hypothetical protein HY909_06920 [Deltaproteobacteria bacterium]|nr:hypothetical protein [Deltaproteobacteria bacterium]